MFAAFYDDNFLLDDREIILCGTRPWDVYYYYFLIVIVDVVAVNLPFYIYPKAIVF